jgi:glycosyltransferase involved in cell wall biosynthesis
MKFSLIAATIGRSAEIERLFDSLAGQEYQDFELILVDQNADDRARKICDKFRDRLHIVYLQSERGLSRARNVGLRYARGDVIAFPDDDCWYPPNVLQQVASQFLTDDCLCGLTGCSIDSEGKVSQGRWAKRSLTVNRYNIWVCATSYTIFLRAPAVAAVGGFDEMLGVGSGTLWGAGEEVNYLLQVLRRSMYVRYDPNLRIFHPEPIVNFDATAFSRARLYNRGLGRVLRLNRYPLFFVLYKIIRPLAGSALSFCQMKPKRAVYYWIAASQRLLGWLLRG